MMICKRTKEKCTNVWKQPLPPLYNYLRSMFHVWNRILFEGPLGGSGVIHYRTATPSILAPSQGVVLNCYMGLWMTLCNVAGRWRTFNGSGSENKTGRGAVLFQWKPLFDDHWLLLFFCPLLARCCRCSASRSCAAWLFETASRVSQFTLWDGGGGEVFPLRRSSASNTTPLS